MDASRIFLIVVGIGGLIFLLSQIPGMIKTKRDLDQAEINFRQYMKDLDDWMRG